MLASVLFTEKWWAICFSLVFELSYSSFAPTDPFLILNNPDNYIFGLTFSPDGRTLASGGTGGRVRLLEISCAECRLNLSNPFRIGEILDTAISPNGRLLAFAYTGKGRECFIDLVSLSTNGLLHTLSGHKNAIRRIVFSPDGSLVASGSNDGTARIWDVNTGKSKGVFQSSAAIVYDLAFSPDAKSLALSSSAKLPKGENFYLWDIATGIIRSKWFDEKEAIYRICFSSDQRYLFSAGLWGNIRRRDLVSGKLIDIITKKGSDALEPSKVAFSRDAKLVAIEDKSIIRLWDLEAGKLTHLIAVGGGGVARIAISPDRNTLAVAEGDHQGKISLYDISRHTDFLKHSVVFPEKRSQQSSGEHTDHSPERKQQLEKFWGDLASRDASRAYRSLWHFVDYGEDVVGFIAHHLKSESIADENAVARWIANLNSPNFKIRELAKQNLENQGESIKFDLMEALRKSKSLEVNLRIKQLLSKCDSIPVARLRQLRAIEILELINHNNSIALLTKLTTGSAKSRLTREAIKSLSRMREKNKK